MNNILRSSVKIALLFIAIAAISDIATAENGPDNIFFEDETKEQFARDISSVTYDGWKKWQDGVIIKDINVEGSQGLLLPGDMRGNPLTLPLIMESFDRKNKSQDYIATIRAVAGAVANGMRKWQKEYRNENISFPQGANTVITLPPCQNLPVALDSGSSSGDRTMTEEVLYGYMLYRAPGKSIDIRGVLRAAAKAISQSFDRWKAECSIVGIVASGGIGPQPAPMGPGPGPVRGAQGNNGKLIGAYIDRDLMYNRMIEHYKSYKP